MLYLMIMLKPLKIMLALQKKELKGKGTRDTHTHTKKLRIFPFCIDFSLFIIYKYTSDVLRMKVLINLMVLKSSNGILQDQSPTPL